MTDQLNSTFYSDALRHFLQSTVAVGPNTFILCSEIDLLTFFILPLQSDAKTNIPSLHSVFTVSFMRRELVENLSRI